MNKKLFQNILYVVVAIVVVVSLVLIISSHDKESNYQIANPASVYCQENGGTLEMRMADGGQIGVCKFSDGTVCEEWDYYNGGCEKGFSIYLTLEEYYANIDTSCQTDADCVIKNVGNCCGELPKCVNEDYVADPDFVSEKCKDEDLFSGCGFVAFNSCECKDNNCKAAEL